MRPGVACLALAVLTAAFSAAKGGKPAVAESSPCIALVPSTKFDGKAGRLLAGLGSVLKLHQLDGMLEKTNEANSNGLVMGLAVDEGPKSNPAVAGYSIRKENGRATVFAVRHELKETAILSRELPDHSELGGIAAFNQRIVVALPKPGEIWLIDASTGKLERQSLPDFPTPRSPAYDASGTLWMLSANSVAELQFTEDGHFNPIHHRGDFDHALHLAVRSKQGFLITCAEGDGAILQWTDPKLKTIRKAPLPDKSCRVTSGADGRIWAVSNKGGIFAWEAKAASWKNLRTKK